MSLFAKFFSANALQWLYSPNFFTAKVFYCTVYFAQAPQAPLAALVEWMLDGLSKRLNGIQLEAISLNKRQLEATLGFYHII